MSTNVALLVQRLLNMTAEIREDIAFREMLEGAQTKANSNKLDLSTFACRVESIYEKGVQDKNDLTKVGKILADQPNGLLAYALDTDNDAELEFELQKIDIALGVDMEI